MSTPVQAAFNADHTRASFRLAHPTGNLITDEMVEALAQALESIADTPHLKLITIEGDGPDFSFGASISEHTPDAIARVLPRMHALILQLLGAPAVTAAVVRGRCLGGGFELALACDVIFASDDSVLGLPEIALGVYPPAGAALLPARIGAARASRAIITGEPRPAAEWLAAGLVELVVPAASLEQQVTHWYERHLAPRSASSLRFAAAAARHSLAAHVGRVLPDLERLYLDDLMRTADAVEGVAAFLEKRLPRWTDS